MQTPEDSRHQIVEAASQRFSYFGYGKTTMAEIAGDCRMSVGNLYRFFPGKLDLAAHIVEMSAAHDVAVLRKAAARKYKSAAVRIEALVIAELRATFDVMENRPTLADMGRIVMERRVEVINRGLAATRQVMTEVIEDGMASGELAVEDAGLAAEMIQAATMKFRYPQLWSLLSLTALEREAKGVIRLFVRGLASRKN